MTGRVRELILRLLKVPPPPAAPAGAGEVVRVFRAARGFYRYLLLRWGLKQGAAAFGLLYGVVFLGATLGQFNLPWQLPKLFLALEAMGLLTFLVQLPVTFFLLNLDYEMRWYLTTDRSLRIREGVWRVSEKTMTFANIQNLAIRQGPLQRRFGISDLEVRTAGGGSKSSHEHGKHRPGADLHLGYFRGIDNAAEIRDAVLEQLRAHRHTGLGDPGEGSRRAVATPAQGSLDATVAAARELLSEARALRAAGR